MERLASVGEYNGPRMWLIMRGWGRRRVKVYFYPVLLLPFSFFSVLLDGSFILMTLLQFAVFITPQGVSMNRVMRARRIAIVIAIAEMMALRDHRNGDADTIMTTTTVMTILMTMARERGGGRVRMHTRRSRNLKALDRKRKAEDRSHAQ
jgi:hypothetical protein